MDTTKMKTVIVGGGFAGINLAQQLLKSSQNIHVTLVDRNNYNFFPPLLYQVATGFLDVSNISYPYRRLFRNQPNFTFQMGELLEIRPDQNTIELSTGELHYDNLIIATGTTSNYFGMQNIEKYSLPMKTIDDAIALKNTLLSRLEIASRTQDKAERKRLTTIVVAGGGPTGVEVAGMLSELRQNIFKKDYPELADLSFDIYLVDGMATLLTPMSEKSQAYTLKSLTNMGVQVKLNKRVTDFQGERVSFADGEVIETRNLIWAAGVTSQRFKGLPVESYGRGNRLLVDAFNKVQGEGNIYAIGDNCLQTTDPAFTGGHPQVAQVAIQQGQNLAKNLVATMNGGNQKPFTYHDKGSMAIIGRNKAVTDLPKPAIHMNGFIAWLMWLFVHLISLVNFRNKLKTAYNWVAAYLSKDQHLRMIVKSRTLQEEEADHWR
ncbi:NAD(P)/FAD-dependent oxidoreductase [Mucilaginibacter lacusdianchii]|uniref:NAD(P)/FAD-dependent oxidoreductase n=1 Tax=Mucilaginibacter lacusdianchii TaxID=2684211 RepID=UPI001E51EC5D|nr:NAD(P)/FAD-dependent oxidoreductase [Mucilaginibacter sp. JXJ CY 39]